MFWNIFSSKNISRGFLLMLFSYLIPSFQLVKWIMQVQAFIHETVGIDKTLIVETLYTTLQNHGTPSKCEILCNTEKCKSICCDIISLPEMRLWYQLIKPVELNWRKKQKAAISKAASDKARVYMSRLVEEPSTKT